MCYSGCVVWEWREGPPHPLNACGLPATVNGIQALLHSYTPWEAGHLLPQPPTPPHPTPASGIGTPPGKVGPPPPCPAGPAQEVLRKLVWGICGGCRLLVFEQAVLTAVAGPNEELTAQVGRCLARGGLDSGPRHTGGGAELMGQGSEVGLYHLTPQLSGLAQ